MIHAPTLLSSTPSIRLAWLLGVLTLAAACSDDGASDPPIDTEMPPATAEAGMPPSGDDAVTIPSDAGVRPDDSDVDAGGIEIRAMLETVVIDQKTEADRAPIALFRDGSACRDLEFVFVTGGDATAHRAVHPDAWTTWKLEDSKIALQTGGALRTLTSQHRYGPLGQGAPLDGAFMRLADGGADDVSIAAQSELAFDQTGRFVQGDFAAAYPDLAASEAPPDQQGSYEIDGYRILLRYDDGGTATTTIVFDPSEPDTLFLGGRAFGST